MNKVLEIQNLLKETAKTLPPPKVSFFKTGEGEYAEHDEFIGVPVPVLRQIAKKYLGLTLDEIKLLMKSPINEERLLALIILVSRFDEGTSATKTEVFNFYMEHLPYVNNWNLVDASAHLIIGAHLFHGNPGLLYKLADSKVLWEKRIAIVATWYFIKQNDCFITIEIAKKLLNDEHDLIQKAVGWMLREVGNKDVEILKKFLYRYSKRMPRTMLRYAIEKFSEKDRKNFMKT